MKKYRYSGPASGVTLSDGTEILLWPGKNVSLPEQHGKSVAWYGQSLCSPWDLR